MDVRNRILEESGLLFGKYGIRSMTMDALAEEMGISKRTIYERFKDKDTLLREVFYHFKKKRSEEAMRILDESDNAIEAMFRIMQVTIRQIEQMNPSFFHDFKKYHREVFREISEPGEMRDYDITRRLLETGVKQKIFRSNTNIRIVNRTLHELFNLFGHESPLVMAGFHHKEMFDHMIIPYLRGISTDRGMVLLEECRKILD